MIARCRPAGTLSHPGDEKGTRGHEREKGSEDKELHVATAYESTVPKKRRTLEKRRSGEREREIERRAAGDQEWRTKGKREREEKRRRKPIPSAENSISLQDRPGAAIGQFSP